MEKKINTFLHEEARGAVFFCNNWTYHDCIGSLIFGAPNHQWDSFVNLLRPRIDIAFLWHLDRYTLYGAFEILEKGFPVSRFVFGGVYSAQIAVEWKYPRFNPIGINVIKEEIPFLRPYLKWSKDGRCFLTKQMLDYDELIELLRIFELKTLKSSGGVEGVTRKARVLRKKRKV